MKTSAEIRDVSPHALIFCPVVAALCFRCAILANLQLFLLLFV